MKKVVEKKEEEEWAWDSNMYIFKCSDVQNGYVCVNGLKYVWKCSDDHRL